MAAPPVSGERPLRSAKETNLILKQDHYLYIYGTERLPVGLDMLEDEIFEQIEGQGDVTGAGTGDNGWNIDIEFESLSSTDFILMSSLKTFRRHGISDGVTFDIDGHRESLADLDRRYSATLNENEPEAEHDEDGKASPAIS
jgi:hypothetical protein